MVTLLTLKDTSLLFSRSALFPTRAAKTNGQARRGVLRGAHKASLWTNSFASSNERLCVMSYTTITAYTDWSKEKTSWRRLEVFRILILFILPKSTLRLVTREDSKRSNDHGLKLRWLHEFSKINLIASTLIVKRFLTFPSRRMAEIKKDSVNSSRHSRMYSHGILLFLNRGKKTKN